MMMFGDFMLIYNIHGDLESDFMLISRDLWRFVVIYRDLW
jgi:hypothetical protein